MNICPKVGCKASVKTEGTWKADHLLAQANIAPLIIKSISSILVHGKREGTGLIHEVLPIQKGPYIIFLPHKPCLIK